MVSSVSERSCERRCEKASLLIVVLFIIITFVLIVQQVVAKVNNKHTKKQINVAKSIDIDFFGCYYNIAKRNKEVKRLKNKYPILRRVKGRITEKGETYRSVSEKTGIPLNSLSNKLNGKSLCDIIEVSKLCCVLDIPAEEIPIFFEIDVA